MDYLGWAGSVFGLVALITGAVMIIRSTATKTTIIQQKELIDILNASRDEQRVQIQDLNEKHIESSKAIAGLQGQVDVLKNIPLKEISADMKSIATQMNSLSTNQQEITNLLKQNGFHKKP